MSSAHPQPTPPAPLPSPPDGLPELTVGSHRRPTQGACLMEYVSVLAGLPFSAGPTCTHPALCVLAQQINDATSDAGRPRLALLAPNLIGVRDDRSRVSNVAATVVLGVTTAALSWAPHDPFIRRLQRRAADQHDTGGRRWRYALSLALGSLLRHLANVDADTRDRCLYAVLERVVEECRAGTVVMPGPPLIDRIDRRPRALR
jgi:hypothetical protein